jgi:hypothetical protein
MTTVDYCVPSDIRDSALYYGSGGAVAWSSDTSRRSGGYSLRLGQFGGDGFAKMSVPGSSASKTIRFAVWLSEYMDSSTSRVAICEGTTEHIRMYFDVPDEKIKFSNADGTIQDWVTGCTKNAWNLYELKFTLHDSTGALSVKWQGAEILTLTSKDTRYGGTPIVNNVYFYKAPLPGLTVYMYVDDFVTADDWIGAGTLIVKVPTAAGTDSAWTASAGSAFACVDELPPSDTDYIYAAGTVSGTKHTFTHGTLDTTPSHIAFVMAIDKLRLNDAGSGTARVIALSGTTYAAGTNTVLSTTSQFAQCIMMTDPNTGEVWGLDGVNACEVGAETQT